MTKELWLANVIAHLIQAGAVTAVAALVHVWLRRSHPALRLALWQTVLALNVLAPVLQPWRPLAAASAAGADGVSTSFDAAGSGLNAAGHALGGWTVIVWILAGGVVLRLAWLAIGLIRLRSLARASEPLAELPEAARRAIRDVGTNARFHVSRGAGPVSFGARRPIVVVPPRFLSLAPQSQYLIAAHELQHVRRRDFIQGLLEETAAALLWYQPWTWWSRAQVRLAREQVVDRRVGATQSVRGAYVETLLTMAGHAVPALSSGAAFPKVRELGRRIDALYKEVPMSRVRLAFSGALAAASVLSLAVAVAAAFPLRTATSSGSPVPAVSVAAQAAQDDEPVRIGGDVKPPNKIKDVKPVYPKDAKDARIQGVVILEIVVDREGRVSDVEVARSIPELDQAAVDAVQQWEFEPTYVKGKAVSVRMTVTVNFVLA